MVTDGAAWRRLCRLMCGKALPFRAIRFEGSEAGPRDVRHSLQILLSKPEGLSPFRTSGGLAALNYSHLSDSIGSRLAAFHAGHKPKIIPTPAEMPIPTPMAQGGT